MSSRCLEQLHNSMNSVVLSNLSFLFLLSSFFTRSNVTQIGVCHERTADDRGGQKPSPQPISVNRGVDVRLLVQTFPQSHYGAMVEHTMYRICIAAQFFIWISLGVSVTNKKNIQNDCKRRCEANPVSRELLEEGCDTCNQYRCQSPSPPAILC